MPEPISTRTVEIVAQWLAEDPGLPEVGTNLEDFSNDKLAADKPAVFVVLAGQEGLPLVRETDEGVVEPTIVYVVGYVRAPDLDEDSEPVKPNTSAARERLIQTIRKRLAFRDTVPNSDGLSGAEVDSLDARLRYDGCCEGFEEIGPTQRDEGEEPPWGFAILRCVARLHYQAGNF